MMRILAFFLVAALAVTACSGPSASGGRTPAPTLSGHLRFSIFGGGGSFLSWMDHGASSFAGANPGVSVATTLGNFYSEPVPYADLEKAYFGDPPPDLVSGFVGGSLRADAAAGRLLDLTDLWTELGLDEAVPASVADLASVDGHRYWIPTLAQWNPIFYNTTAFAQAGVSPPQSWQELLRACSALRSAGVSRPIAQAGAAPWSPPAARWFSSIDLALNGAAFHEALASGKVAWTDPRVRAVFDRWQELFDAGCYGDPALQSYGDAVLDLKTGSAAMENLGEWIFESTALPDDAPVDFFRPPVIDPSVGRTDIVLVYGLAIPAKAEDPALAKELIRALVSPSSLKRAYITVPRVILDTRVDPGYLPRHTAGLKLFESATSLTELWEFEAPSPQAETGLALFQGFLADPTALDRDLALAEQSRAAAFGPPSYPGG
jgi:multiple sugar transport system substrate-binding protein